MPYYPINDFGPAMKGIVIGGMGIIHVFLAQFAIGGGFLLCYFQWLDQTRRETYARTFLDGFFKLLVLASFVLGALTGVGMWFTTIQVSPRTIGLMVSEFHWIWAIEWTFFCLEVFAGYLFYRYGERLSNPTRMRLLVCYSVAAWFSLFWINGILSWQLTPGGWSETNHAVWSGFFNPSFLPSLLFRTITALTSAALVAFVVINQIDLPRRDLQNLMQRVAVLLGPMVLMPVLGVWYFMVIPEDSRSWALGGSVAMTLFLALAVACSMLIGLYALLGIVRQKLFINGATAMLLTALAFMATAGGEFVREGVRKPFTVRNTLYSNSITQGEVEHLRMHGSVTDDPYPLKDREEMVNEQVALGAKVYRFQCSVCHTLDGANGLHHLTGSWSPDQLRMNIAKLQLTKPFMPPFAGTPAELEALVQYLRWTQVGRPSEWAVSGDLEVLDQITAWLEEAGTAPGSTHSVHHQGKEP